MIEAPSAIGGRPTCYRCFKPRITCICEGLGAVDNRTGVIILQHPRERHHALGTVRFARLGLSRVDVRVCGPKDEAAMARACVFPPNCAFLYPSADGRDVASLGPGERPDHLVIVDGTWHHAHSLVRAARQLRELPHVYVQPATPSAYRVRREPRAECLSTIEATVAALQALEPETTGLDELLAAFRRMVDRQYAWGVTG